MPSPKPAVMQMIDSLAMGGAERVAVNLANALAEQGLPSHLCVTRHSGPLEAFVRPEVKLLVLNRRRTFDVAALRRLAAYIKANGIGVLHAHSSSFFMAALARCLCRVKIVWHDHDGHRASYSWVSGLSIKFFSLFFNGAIAVNHSLENWAKKNLWISADKCTYLPNFPDLSPVKQGNENTEGFPGTKAYRIASLANLRYPKDHRTLVASFAQVHARYPDAHLLLIGKNSHDDYSIQLGQQITEAGLAGHVHILGSRTDVADILAQCAVGVLSSESEGLPVALLEYGLTGLPVACTRVGQCAEVLDEGRAGLLMPLKNPEALAQALCTLLENPEKASTLGQQLQQRVNRLYSKQAITEQLTVIYQSL